MKVNWGAFIVDGRGKLGGHVAQKNTYGSVLRTKTTPVNRRSSRQQNRRAMMAELTGSWADLTETQRSGWKNFAISNPVTDIFGNKMNLSGMNIYCQVNLNFSILGLEKSKSERQERRDYRRAYRQKSTIATTPPSFTIDSSVAISEVTNIAVYASPPISPGKSSAGSQYKHIVNLTDSDTFPYDFLADYEKVYGTIVAEGEKVFVKFVQIEVISGLANPPIISSSIIIETLPI